MRLPLALCNEMFENTDAVEVARRAVAHGYQALELAPFTLAEYPARPTAAELRRLRSGLQAAGMSVLGLHWLLARTSGLHAASPEEPVRRRTIEHLGYLAQMCAALGGWLMVFGSPQQRSTLAGANRQDTLMRFKDTLAAAAQLAASCNVIIALEPLTPAETDIVTSAAEAVQIIEEVGHPSLRLHLDARAMQAEAEPRECIIRRYGRQLASFHANDPNRLGPGMGQLDFAPILQALGDVGYRGYLSVEVFDFSPGPDVIASRSAHYLTGLMARQNH